MCVMKTDWPQAVYQQHANRVGGSKGVWQGVVQSHAAFSLQL
jgi:hypothetical protein